MKRRDTSRDYESLPLEDEIVTMWDAGDALQHDIERACADWTNLDAEFFAEARERVTEWKRVAAAMRAALAEYRASMAARASEVAP